MTPFVDSRAGLGLPSSDPLVPYGWTPALEAARQGLSSGGEPARVVAASRGLALAQTASGEAWGEPTGRFRDQLRREGLTLCAGDWVLLQANPGPSRASITALLPRGPSLLRQGTGPGAPPQCLAANLDLVLAVMGLDRNFNLARLERLLALAWGSGAQPVAVLTKRDLSTGWEAHRQRVEGMAPGVPVRALSACTGEGLADLQAQIARGGTAVLVGSSGAGKSTLLNALLGTEARRTQAVRASDGRGRHTTSLRELFLLPGGGCLIDTPGIREVGLCAGSDPETTFSEITDLARNCRFRDCAHGAEPGCAVQAALAQGLLDPARFEHYLRLRREVAFEAARGDERLWREREDRWHQLSRLQKQFRKR
jgi:ribosome biogenesis GTPase / thiamine phosphate phosphatase